eukprot:2915079-Rhodomonas_salina.1
MRHEDRHLRLRASLCVRDRLGELLGLVGRKSAYTAHQDTCGARAVQRSRKTSRKGSEWNDCELWWRVEKKTQLNVREPCQSEERKTGLIAPHCVRIFLYARRQGPVCPRTTANIEPVHVNIDSSMKAHLVDAGRVHLPVSSDERLARHVELQRRVGGALALRERQRVAAQHAAKRRRTHGSERHGDGRRREKHEERCSGGSHCDCGEEDALHAATP